MEPKKISDAMLAFPADVRDMMPDYEDIPPEFKSSGNEWVRMQRSWFYEGLSAASMFMPSEGIEAEEAFRHLSAIQGSFQPKHEHKVAAVAYLAHLWFDSAAYGPKGTTKKEDLTIVGDFPKELLDD